MFVELAYVSFIYNDKHWKYIEIWRRKWQPIPVFLPGESYGQRSLEGYSPWGHKELDTTERLPLHFTSKSLCFSSLEWWWEDFRH